MVPQEQKPAGISCPTEVNDHDAVLRRLDPDLDVAAQQNGFLLGQIADKYRVLNPLAVTFHAGRDAPQPTILADVISDEITAAGHDGYLVTSGSYCGSSPIRCAARIRA